MIDKEFLLPENFLTLGDLADAWISRHCVIPDGINRGQPFKLCGWQYWCLAHQYAIKKGAEYIRPELVGPNKPPVGNQAFVFRQTLIIAPQKTGKGPFSAACIALEAVGPSYFAGFAAIGDVYKCLDNGCSCGWTYEYEQGEPMGMRHPSPLIQITANSADQADNIYRPLLAMIKLGRLNKLMSVRENFIRIHGKAKQFEMDRIDKVTSSATSRLGNPISAAFQDEVGLYTQQNKMIKTAQTQRRGAAGMGGRTFCTTNAWDPSIKSYAEQIFNSKQDDVFVFYQDPTTLTNTNGKKIKQDDFKNAALRRQILEFVYKGSWWVNLDSVNAEVESLLKSDPQQAMRFFGNFLVQGEGSFLPNNLWEARIKSEPEEMFDICLGFDGSTTDDWTAIRAETKDGYRFTPLYKVGNEWRYTTWKPKTYHNELIPRSEVMAAFDQIFDNYNVKRCYLDPRDWQTEIEVLADKYGDKVIVRWYTNNISNMHMALNRYINDLANNNTQHDDNIDAKFCAFNAIKLARNADRYILGKPAIHQKIDVLMADILAHEAAADTRKSNEWNRDSGVVYVWKK